MSFVAHIEPRTPPLPNPSASTGAKRPPDRPDRIGCLVLAAGAGRRFAGVKQLAELDGRPLLDHALAVAAGVDFDRRAVVLGANAEAILDRVPLRGLAPIRCERWEEGMSASLRAGVEAFADLDAVVVLLGDQPFVTARAVDRLLSRRTGRDDATRATYDGQPGHPVVIERSLFGRIAGLEGDEGARRLLARARTLEVPCEDVSDPFDIDRPADLAAARAKR